MSRLEREESELDYRQDGLEGRELPDLEICLRVVALVAGIAFVAAAVLL